MKQPGLYRYRRVDMTGIGSVRKVTSDEMPEGVFDLLHPSLAEMIEYSQEVPYSIVRQTYLHADDIHLHFGATLEIMLLSNLRGSITVYGHNTVLDGSERLIIILPNTLHSGRVYPEPIGTIINLKFSLRDMNRFINLENMLAANGHSLNDLLLSKPAYEQVFQTIIALADADDDFYLRMCLCMKLFELFDKGIPVSPGSKALAQVQNDDKLNNLIRWTETHFAKNITLDEASQLMNFSKAYFCKYFKRKTGMTYLAYLTQIRMHHAQKLLLSGVNASECCYQCGFENVAYFIQLFKKATGYTTSEYRKLFSD